jgi:HTH-type transcriptional regulator / antitoxin HipB
MEDYDVEKSTHGVNISKTAQNIGAAIREARVRAYLTQAELGAFAGVDRFAIARLEKGLFTTQGLRLFDVLDALGMEVEIVPRSERLATAETARVDGAP